jgi:hypothetical protein
MTRKGFFFLNISISQNLSFQINDSAVYVERNLPFSSSKLIPGKNLVAVCHCRGYYMVQRKWHPEYKLPRNYVKFYKEKSQLLR